MSAPSATNAATNGHVHDVLVIGSGAAGLALALQLPARLKVAILSKGPLHEGCTYYAQGGIAAAMDAADSFDAHVQDTLIAGGGLCDEKVVRFVVENGPKAIERLAEWGVAFSREDGQLHLTREGGHSTRRVVHAADATGKAVESVLVEQVLARPNLEIFERHIAVDLITDRKLGGSGRRCLGAYALERDSGRVRLFRARAVILATGGASKVYLYTSNPDSASGDGIAMAWRAGCRVANLEFSQFHPTCLYHPQAKTFLITEAIRGEGGVLRLPDGTRFMDRFDKRAELAPRDIVARAIDHEMKRTGSDCVYLDISHRPAAFILQHFPTIHAICLEYGIDITRQPIPVVPAAHYTCGGVMADLRGRADLAGLYAIGEVAFSGLHGANRMASNSILECLVFAHAAAEDIAATIDAVALPTDLPPWDETWVSNSDEEVVVSHNWQELRHFMWDYVGIVRSTKRLERAKRRVDLLMDEIGEYYGHFRVSNDLIELRNLVQVADLIIRCAMARAESRGLHYTIDHPIPDDSRPPKPTILIPPNQA